MQFVTEHFNYWVVIVLMMTGLYVVIVTGNLVKKLVGLGMFQTSVFQLYITMGKVHGGRPPILEHLPGESAEPHGVVEAHAPILAEGVVQTAPLTNVQPAPGLHGVIYSNPVPMVLILTAIVVGVATLAVGLALVVRIRENFGSIEEADIDAAEYQQEVEAQ